MKEQFSSRWGIILASLGMAIGAGNIWRFPRLAGQYGGTFIILWLVFLIVWSIPILLTEFSMGKKFKKGVIGAFTDLAGPSYSWMGFFIAVCTLCITFYYSVVVGWALRYLSFSTQNAITEATGGQSLQSTINADPDYLNNYWTQISSHDILSIILHILAVGLAISLLIRGINKGWEMANKILIPTLFGLLLVTSIYALNLDGALKGLEYMFEIRPELFSDPKVWLEALSQSAWSTGAGWGLIITISSYTRSKEDVTLNTFIGGFGNNTASLIAGMTVLPAVFGLAASPEQAVQHLQAGNQGLTFQIIPALFSQIDGGQIIASIFFLALFVAALSSLLPMIELLVKMITDLGIIRHKATLQAGLICIVLGLPSAYSLDFFNNQDWVWGIGLVISGLFIIFGAFKYGINKVKTELIDADSDIIVPRLYYVISMGLNLVLGVVIILWWMTRGYSENNYDIFDVYSNATIIFQWGLILIIGLLLNRKIAQLFGKKHEH